MAKNKVKVNIASKAYTIIGEDATEHMISVGQMVDTHVREIAASYPALSVSDRAVLAAINVADEYIKTREKLMSMVEELTASEQLLIERLDDLTRDFETLQSSLEAAERRAAEALKQRSETAEKPEPDDAEIFFAPETEEAVQAGAWEDDTATDQAEGLAESAPETEELIEPDADEEAAEGFSEAEPESEDFNETDTNEEAPQDVAAPEPETEDATAQEDLQEPQGFAMDNESAGQDDEINGAETEPEENAEPESDDESDIMAFLKPDETDETDESGETSEAQAFEAPSQTDEPNQPQDDSGWRQQASEADDWDADEKTPDGEARSEDADWDAPEPEKTETEADIPVDDFEDKRDEQKPEEYDFGGQTSFDFDDEKKSADDEEDYPDTSMLDRLDYGYQDDED